MKNAKVMAATGITIVVAGMTANVDVMLIAQYLGFALGSQAFMWVNQ